MDQTNSSWLKTFSIGFSIISFGITLAIIGYIVLTTKQNQTANQQPITPSPTILQPSSTIDPTVNRKTYTNTKHSYSFSYPSNWLILTPGGQYGDKCINSTGKDDIIELAQKTLDYCGFVGEQLPNSEAEFTIWVLDKPWKEEEILTRDATGKDISKEIIVAGEKAMKTPFTERSYLPNIQATRIYFNHNNRGYLMFIKQTDKKGNYDPTYDQILSTFKFVQ